MSRITGIDTVFYQVCNMDRAVEFYRDVLGLTLDRREGNDWAEFSGGSVTFALSGELAVQPQGGGATVVFTTDDLDGLYEDLRSKRVNTGKIQDMGGARMLDIYDPDNNQVVVLSPVG